MTATHAGAPSGDAQPPIGPQERSVLTVPRTSPLTIRQRRIVAAIRKSMPVRLYHAEALELLDEVRSLAWLCVLHRRSSAVLAVELPRSKGRPKEHAKHQLAHGLAAIWFAFTGKPVARTVSKKANMQSGAYKRREGGAFKRFVEAVLPCLPVELGATSDWADALVNMAARKHKPAFGAGARDEAARTEVSMTWVQPAREWSGPFLPRNLRAASEEDRRRASETIARMAHERRKNHGRGPPRDG